MTTLERHQLHNPFLKSNPFYRPQKFYSQPKVSQLPQLPQFEYHIPFHNSNYSLQSRYHCNQNSLSSSCQYSQSHMKQETLKSNMKVYDNRQKDKRLTKVSIKTRQNPFLRKHLIPATKENVAPTPCMKSDYQLEEHHRRLFNSLPKNSKKNTEETVFTTNMISTPPYEQECVKSPRIGNLKQKISLGSQEKQLERLTVRSPQGKKYLSSELQIKLKSQTCIQAEEEAISMQTGYNKERDPLTLVVSGKKFYLAEVECIA